MKRPQAYIQSLLSALEPLRYWFWPLQPRAFVFVQHNQLGFIVLRARKTKKGCHTPGGRIDGREAPAAAAARELFEETGICVQHNLQRMIAVTPSTPFHHPPKHFFHLTVQDSDFPTGQDTQAPEGSLSHRLGLRLSREHRSCFLAHDYKAAADAITLHSKGSPAIVLRQFGCAMPPKVRGLCVKSVVVVVTGGDRVDQITFHCGEFLGGSEREPFVLWDGEYIVWVRVRQGDLSLDAVQFVTNTGRESLMYGGGQGGRPITSFFAEPGHQVTGTVRSLSGRIEALEQKPMA